MAKQVFKSKLVLLILLIIVIISCSKETKSTKVQPLKTTIKGKAISENQNKVKIEDNQDNDILKTIYTGKAENDDIMLKFNKITKDSLFGEHTLKSTVNGNIRIKLLKGVFTKDQNNTINATLTEYKLNDFEKPKYKTNAVLKFIISNKNIDGIIDFGAKKINFSLTPIEVSNEEFESRDFGNVYEQSNNKPLNKVENEINIIFDEYEKQLNKIEILINKSNELQNGKLNNTQKGRELALKVNELGLTLLTVSDKLKKYKKSQLTNEQIKRWTEMTKKLKEIFEPFN